MTKKMRLSLFFIAALSFLQVPPPLFAQEEKKGWQNGWAEQQKAKYDQLTVEYQRRALQAQDALQKAQNALQLAETRNDQKAIPVAKEAIRIARLAIERLRTIRSTIDARREALERAIRWQNEGRSEVGVTSVVKGKMYKKGPTGWALFSDGSPLLAGEEAKTGPDGFAELIFPGGSIMQLGPNTNIKPTKLETEHSVFDFIEGRVHAEFQCLKKALKPCREIRVRHGAGAVLAVRGTELNIQTLANGATKVIVLEGIVEISDPNADKIVKAETGESVILTTEGKVEDPTHLELRSLEHWWEIR